MLIVYERVSPEEQNLDREIYMLVEDRVNKINIYQEKITATKKDRSELNKKY